MEGITKQTMDTPIPNGFTITTRIDGIVNNMGKAAGLEQNWAYNALDEKGNKCVLLYCNPGNFTIIDSDSLDNIRNVNDKKVSWFIGKNGYVGCRTVIGGKDTVLTLHQHLMNHYGYGRGKESIDHINRNKLDNRLTNLRITTQSIQNENRDKVKRHKTAKELPDEIKDITLPKFVVYYREKVGENSFREFFTVEGHPLQKEKEKGVINNQTKQLKARRWATTKSNKISIISKLNYAKLYISELDKLKENALYIMKDINKPVNESKKIESKVIEINKIINDIKQEEEIINKNNIKNEEKVNNKIILPKNTCDYRQWKVKQIYEAIQANNENTYKEFCEQNNDTSKIQTWESDWVKFVLSVKGKTQKDAEKTIRDFIENLRRLRHNELCYEKNSSLVDRENRLIWPAITVVRAFLDGKLDTFKEFTEKQTGDNPDDKAWQKRWQTFVTSLEENKADEDKLKKLCSKFMTAQRTKRYRRK